MSNILWFTFSRNWWPEWNRPSHSCLVAKMAALTTTSSLFLIPTVPCHSSKLGNGWHGNPVLCPRVNSPGKMTMETHSPWHRLVSERITNEGHRIEGYTCIVFKLWWWCHQMGTFSMLLAICEGNPLVTGGFPSQRPEMQSFDIFFDLCLNKRLTKQSRCWWLEMPSCSLWCYCNVCSCMFINKWILNQSVCILV